MTLQVMAWYLSYKSYLQVMAWDKNSQEGQFITGLDAERVIVNEMRKKVGFQFIYNHCFFHFGANITYTRLK